VKNDRLIFKLKISAQAEGHGELPGIHWGPSAAGRVCGGKQL